MLAQLARSLAAILTPLDRALADPGRLELMLAAAGWDTSRPLDEQAVAAAGRALGVGDDLRTLLSLANGTPNPVEAAQAVAAGSRVLARLIELAESDPAHGSGDVTALAAALPPPLDDPEAVLAAIGDIEATLVSLWLGATLPPVRTALRVAGVSTGSNPERVAWPALLRLFSDPKGQLTDTTGWGGPLSLEALDRAARAVGDLLPRPLVPGMVDPEIGARYWGPVGPPAGTVQYGLTLLEAAHGLTGDIGLVLVPVPAGPDADPKPTGVLLAPAAVAGAAIPVALGDTWSATVTASVDLDGTFGVVARPAPGGGVTVSAETGASSLDVELVLGAPSARWTLGDPGGPQITLAGVTVSAGIRDGAEPYVTVTAVDGIVLTLVPPDGNGFLRSLLGAAADITFAISVDVSSGGVRLSGSVGLSVTVVLDRDLGPLHLDQLEVEIAPSDDQLQLGLGLAATLAIGPVLIAEQGLGAALVARSTPDGDGTLGELDLSLTLLEPTVLVVSIDSDAVTGGGFVEHDPDSGRYAGGLSLDVLSLGLSAVVILDTHAADDPGWALFASLGLRFPEPIPLGFGFTLLGVGGLLALHRTVDPDALASGLKSGAADAVLFPDDIEADAATVLAGLDDWFPVKEGSTTVGPVVELGWGTPTLISAQLGVIIVVPDLIITVLGSAALVLPTDDAPLLSLHMDVLGAIDLSAGTVTVSASLHDSNLLGVYELSGDMGFYAALSGEPEFLLAVGGYSQGFQPPGGLPSWLADLRRMRASLALAESVEATVTAYVAVTSNTVQFGGSLKLLASAEVLLTTYTADATLSVDVLLTLTPFRIVARETAGATISAGDRELLGVQLTARVEGPQPWYASGRASFDFFGLEVDFGFDVGDHAGGEARAPHDVGGDVSAAMNEPGAWSAFDLADAWDAGVVLAEELPAGLWARPDQRVQVRQSVAPLNREITRFGECVPTTDRVDAGDVVLGARPLPDPEWLTDWFAPAQFDELDDTARLAAPSYELMTAGVRFGDDAVGVPANLSADCASVTLAPEQSIWPDGATAPSPVSGPTAGAPRAPGVRSVAGPHLTVVPTEYVLVRRLDGRAASAPGPYSAVVAARDGDQRVAPSYASPDRRAA